jgi:hypothetical protein
MVEVIAVHPVLVLAVSDHRFDGRSAAHLAFDLGRDAALLLGGIDPELVIGRRIVAVITGIGVQPLDFIADGLLDRRDDRRQRVPIIRIARQCLGMDGELAALATLERGGEADLDAELVGLVRLALADAFDLEGSLRSSISIIITKWLAVPRTISPASSRCGNRSPNTTAITRISCISNS